MSGYVIPRDMLFLAADRTSDWCCMSEWDEWACTRDQGHSGKHEASGERGGPVFAVWDDEAAS